MKHITYDGPNRIITSKNSPNAMQTMRIKRIFLCALIVCVMIAPLTGCGFAGPSKMDCDYNENKMPIDSNRLVVEWDDKISSVDTNNNPVAGKTGLWNVELSISEDYGINSSSGVGTIFRDVAILMYESIFSDKDYDRYSDKFDSVSIGDGSWEPFSLDPATLIQEVNTVTSDALEEEDGALSILTSAIQGMAAAILIAVWAMGFISQVVNEKFTMETLLKTLMQLMCGILLITNSTVIVDAFANAGNALVESLDVDASSSSYGAFSGQIFNLLTTNISSMNIGISVGSLFQLGIGTIWLDLKPIEAIVYMILPIIAQMICAYKIVSMMIMRMLELTIRITLSPIPISFSAQNGFSQDSIRYFRGILACALQPVLMLIGCACVGTISEVVLKIFGSAASTGSLTGFIASLAMCLSYFVLSAFLGETKRMAQEVIVR